MSFLKRLNSGSRTFQALIFIGFSALVIFAATLVALLDYHDPDLVFSEFAALREQDVEFYENQGSLKPDFQGEPDYQLPLNINILFLGLDTTEQVERFNRQEISDTVRTDAIIFATLNIKDREVKAISISRDAKVPIIGYGINDKINQAYRYGVSGDPGTNEEATREKGILAAIDTIENVMGAPVDFYVVIDIDSLINIVDLMGGVYHDVEHDIRADLGQGRVLIPEGYQHLDGEHLFYYVHYRDVYGRQNDRMERHHRILQSAFEQFRSVGKLSKIPKVLSTLRNNVITNLDSRHLGALMQFAAELDMENIKFYTFEGEGMFTEYGYYFYIDEEHRAAVVEEFLGVEVEELGIVKGIPIEFEEEEEDEEPGSKLNLFTDWD